MFITNSIRNMGGAQMYIRNKVVFLKQHGWAPTVFFFNAGDVLIPELKEFINNRIPELAFPITAYNKRKREGVINRIVTDLKDSEECVIESHIYPECYWAEEIARRIHGRHLLFFLHEMFPSYSYKEELFLKFKFDRGEFKNVTRRIEIMLGKHWENKDAFIIPSFSNVTSPVDYPLKYDKGLKTILSIGRLDKPYIMPMLSEIAKYTQRMNVPVNLFLVGGAAEESYMKEIRTFIKEQEMIIPYFFGYMFPIPLNIIQAADVAIASSGSVLVPAEQGIPTISIDTQDYMAMGIYGTTTYNVFKRQDEPQLRTSDLLYDVLVAGHYHKIDAKPTAYTLQAEQMQEDHLRIIESLDAPKEYYDVLAVFSRKEILRQKIVRLIYLIFGERGAGRIVRLRNLIFDRRRRS